MIYLPVTKTPFSWLPEINTRIDDYSEMSSEERNFIAILLAAHEPENILEIGVSSGAGTYLMDSVISHSQKGSRIISYDCAKNWYKDQSLSTGWLYTNNNNVTDNVQIFLEGGLYRLLKELNMKFDFCVLDTVHRLPGELLDFITILPFLNNNAIIVLHDIGLHFDSQPWHKDIAFSNQIVFDTAIGQKYLPKSPNFPYNYPNIGAIKVTDDTRKYIENAFCALALPWQYFPDQDILDDFSQAINDIYGENEQIIFKEALNAQKKNFF